MAVQEFTIIKLVGPAASDAADRFDRWCKARVTDDPDGFFLLEWSAEIRREVSAYLSSLVEHRWELPIVYFSQHVDLWSVGIVFDHCLCGRKAQVGHDSGQLMCYRLPDRGELIKYNEPAAASPGNVPENRWLARRLIEAAEAYDDVWPDAVLLVNRLAITPSSSDDELKRDAAKLPTWMTRAAAAG
jgi:hypothetical protein